MAKNKKKLPIRNKFGWTDKPRYKVSVISIMSQACIHLNEFILRLIEPVQGLLLYRDAFWTEHSLCNTLIQ